MVSYDDADQGNYQYIVLEIDKAVSTISRDQLQQVLWAENVLARRYFYPGCHRMEPYRSHFPHAGLLLPETERLTERVLSLPTGSAMDAESIRTICRIVRFAVEWGKEISDRFMHLGVKTQKGHDG